MQQITNEADGKKRQWSEIFKEKKKKEGRRTSGQSYLIDIYIPQGTRMKLVCLYDVYR